MLFFYSKYNNVTEVLHTLLTLLKVKVTKSYLQEIMENHPDYPSLLSVKETLAHLKVENASLKIPFENLHELPLPFLIHVNEEGVEAFSIVKKMDNDTITWLNLKMEWMTQTKKEFLYIWSGVVMLAEPTEQAGDENYAKNRISELLINLRFPVLLVVAIIVILGGVILNVNSALYNWWILLFSKITGTIICSALLIQLFDKNNPFIAKMCGFGNQTDCNTILNSAASKLWGWLSWSELGFIYFSGGLLAVLLSNSITQMLSIFAIINIFTIPFTFYSLYYQVFVVKKVCTLCLSILILFWIEFIFLFPFWNNVSVQFLNLYPISVGYTVPLLSWMIIKPLANKALQAKQLKTQLSRFKKDPDVFQAILLKQPVMPPVIDNFNTIVLGNPNAANAITVVTIPTCSPCREAHQLLEVLLENNPDLKVQIIFAVGNDDNTTAHKIARYFVFAYLNDLQVQRMMHHWFAHDNLTYEEWAKNYPPYILSDIEPRILEMHETWCEKAFIYATPTLYINTYQKPSLYEIEDIVTILSISKKRKL